MGERKVERVAKNKVGPCLRKAAQLDRSISRNGLKRISQTWLLLFCSKRPQLSLRSFQYLMMVSKCKKYNGRHPSHQPPWGTQKQLNGERMPLTYILSHATNEEKGDITLFSRKRTNTTYDNSCKPKREQTMENKRKQTLPLRPPKHSPFPKNG